MLCRKTARQTEKMYCKTPIRYDIMLSRENGTLRESVWKPWQKKAFLKRQNISSSIWTEPSILTAISSPVRTDF